MPERFDLKPPEDHTAARFEAACRNLGLEVQRGSLRKYAGCIHWHLTMPNQKGTLEATLWPNEGRFWLDMRANRKAEWMEAVVGKLVADFS